MRLCSYDMLRLSDLENAVTEVHSYFDEWDEKQGGGDDEAANQGNAVHEARLAVHEWMANLVQHANFRGRRPRVDLDVQRNGSSIRCVITDNSDGFDLKRQLEKAYDKNNVQALADRGMGLLMLQACASKLSYEATDEGRYRLSFQVPLDSGSRNGFNTSITKRDAA